MKEDYEAHAQAHLASIKRDMRKTMEDATVRAVHKVMAEFEAKSDERLMENAKEYFERINLVQTGVGIGKPAQQEPVAWALYQRGRLHSFWLDKGDAYDFEFTPDHQWKPLYTTPPAQRKPLTHEQRVDLLANFEAHKHEWHAPAILIDMVEAAHGIKEKNT